MTEQVILKWSDVTDGVRRQLSLLGKRTVSREGATQFPRISVTSAEEPALADLAEEGLTRMLGSLHGMWQGLNTVDGGVSFRVSNIRWEDLSGEDFLGVLLPMLRSYLVSYVLGIYLLDVDTGISTRWREDAEQRRLSVVKFLREKEPVSLLGDYADKYSQIRGGISNV